ncbi:MAG: EAL domain-containing protein [Sterolibacterium sp.]
MPDLAAEVARLSRELAQTEARIQQQTQILDQIHDSVIAMDLAGFITQWNKGAERLFGYTAPEAIGNNILFLYVDEDQEVDLQLQDIFLEHGGREMEVRRRKKSGEVFWASLTLSLLRDDHGEPSGMIGYLSDITERKRSEERINYLAYYDAITGLPNRSLMNILVDQSLVEAKRGSQLGALLFIDLNRFKPINDTLGHEVGDRLLQQVGQRFRTALRNADMVARMGGDEFVAALFNITKREHAGNVAQKLLDALDAPILLDGHELSIGASIGISIFPDDGPDSATLLRYADVAMYRAKQAPQKSYAFFSPEMNQIAVGRLSIESGLRRALERGELLLHYQAKVNIETGRIIGAEALVRWNHPERGMVSPAEFIPIAEETGLIVSIGEWVLEEACSQAHTWEQRGIPPLKLAVNISARQINSKLPHSIGALLGRHGLTPDWLELELTESMLMNNTDSVIDMMDELNAMGISLSLDDFGTGFSSLSYLKRFPIDTLKIDRSFVTGTPKDPDDCAIAGAIVGMAKQLRLNVIAEGVENREQLAFLKSLGCDEIQGFLFSRPLPADQIMAMVTSGQCLGAV